MVGTHDGAATWVDHHFLPSWVDEVLFGQLVDGAQVALSWVGVDAAFVVFHQVVADVQESRAFKCITELS